MSLTLTELKGEEAKNETVEATIAEDAVEEKKGTVVETGSGSKITTFTPDEIGAPRKEQNSLEAALNDQLSVLDQGIQANMERLYKEHVESKLEDEADALLGDDSEEDSSNTVLEESVDSEDPEDFAMDGLEEEASHTMDDYKVSETIKTNAPEVKDSKPTNFGELKEDLGKDFFDVEGDIDDEEYGDHVLEDEEAGNELEQVKAEIKANIKPINNVIDLTKFTISKKPATSSSLLKSVEAVTKSADWVLFAGKKAITMTSLNGVELDHFNPRNISNSRNRLNTYKDLYKIMYQHLQDENKPASLEAWTKTIPFYDIDHLYFAVYRACYSDNNLVPYTCEKCGKTSMVKVDIDKMVKFDTPEIEEAFYKIYNKDTTSEDTYKAELIQISDDFVAAVKLPTVFSVIFENAALDEKFLDKYADILGLISYIDAIYLINNDTNELEEVKVKVEVNNFVKTTKRKIATYAKIICSLNSDQYNNFVAKMQDLMNSNDGISYIQPAATCSHCGEKIEEHEVEPLDMVFTRHQLGAISNLSNE